MLDIVLTQHRPAVWTTSAHYDRTFVMITLGRYESEYENVVAPFQDLNVVAVKRVQNPFILGRYKLRKEQLERKSGVSRVHEISMYHPIKREDIDIVAEYNCDYRRYSSSNGSQHANKRPKFYKTPQTAKAQCDLHYDKCSSMAVVKVLYEQSFIPEVVQRDWDTEYVPEYIVELL